MINVTKQFLPVGKFACQKPHGNHSMSEGNSEFVKSERRNGHERCMAIAIMVRKLYLHWIVGVGYCYSKYVKVFTIIKI